MHSSAKLIERAVRFASDDLTKRWVGGALQVIKPSLELISLSVFISAPLYTYWQYADGVFRNMVIGKTKDQLREHWQPSSAERNSPEWNQSIYELNTMAKAIFYDALVCRVFQLLYYLFIYRCQKKNAL